MSTVNRSHPSHADAPFSPLLRRPSRLDRVAHYLEDELLGEHSGIATTAIFDGRAFDGVHAGASWECDPEVPNALPVRVQFTGVDESADDALTALAQQLGEAEGTLPPEATTSGAARTALGQQLEAPKPVYAATLLKSAMGKGKRSKREAFLRTCGLTRMGDTVHLPTFDDSQQARTLNLVQGLHSIERGIVRMEMLKNPNTMVVTDDRGLRRRCFALANPPVVFGRAQFANWMERLASDAARGQ